MSYTITYAVRPRLRTASHLSTAEKGAAPEGGPTYGLRGTAMLAHTTMWRPACAARDGRVAAALRLAQLDTLGCSRPLPLLRTFSAAGSDAPRDARPDVARASRPGASTRSKAARAGSRIRPLAQAWKPRLSDGSVVHYMGSQGRERKVRRVCANGDTEHFAGNKGKETLTKRFTKALGGTSIYGQDGRMQFLEIQNFDKDGRLTQVEYQTDASCSARACTCCSCKMQILTREVNTPLLV